MKNLRTTIPGLLMIAAGVVNAAMQVKHGQEINLPILLSTITGGLGLISAADAKP